MGWEVLIKASNIIMNETVNFEVFVHKDNRSARASQQVKVSSRLLSYRYLPLNSKN